MIVFNILRNYRNFHEIFKSIVKLGTTKYILVYYEDIVPDDVCITRILQGQLQGAVVYDFEFII